MYYSQVAEVDASRFYRLDGCVGEIADNREDNTSHFANQEIWDKLISIDEWREIQLSKIL